MNIIERTQYSADGGKTWTGSREEAAHNTAFKAIAAAVEAYDAPGRYNAAFEVVRLIERNPDALIQAMRDMGALPFDPGHAAQHGYQDGYRDALRFSADSGSLQSCGVTYAVIPAEQHAKEEAALAKIKSWASNGAVYDTQRSARNWCYAHDINWEDN